MSDLNHGTVLLLEHTANTCLFHRMAYHWQSRETQLAGIYKRFRKLLPMATLDRSIRQAKDVHGMKKKHRTGKVTGGGHKWTSSLTIVTFGMVVKMRELGLLTYEQFRQFMVIMGITKQRGPAKLQAPPAAQDEETRKSRHRTFLFPA